MLRELLDRDDYTLKMLTEQFSAGFDPEDWTKIVAALKGGNVQAGE